MKTPLYHLFTWTILCTMTLGCDRCSDEEPAPEKACKLLYRSDYLTTYEYNDKYQLIQIIGNGGVTKYTYDKNGFLTEEGLPDGNIKKYQYTNGLLTKIVYPQGYYNLEANYEYDSQQKLTKSTHTYRDVTYINNYNNGKLISTIRNKSGTITQPFQYENGRVIRVNQNDRSYQLYEYDARGRQIKSTKYDSNNKLESYLETVYQDGLMPENAAPSNFFKGFPDEEKAINPNGLTRTSIYYQIRNNRPVKTSESQLTYILNVKGYPTSKTETYSSLNTSGTWITSPTSKVTYSYINCDE